MDGRPAGASGVRLPVALALVLWSVVFTACGGPTGHHHAMEDTTHSDAAHTEAARGQEAASDTSPSPSLQHLDPPAAADAFAPQLSPARSGGVWLSWLEPAGEGHRLRLARFDGSAWGEARTVTEGDDFFANWADVPSVVQTAGPDGGELLAHWLAKTGTDTYAYGVFLARSDDGGETWRELGTLYDDDSPTEHGFVSLVPAPDGGVDAVWLDGREMAAGGSMTLRAAHVPAGAAGRDEIRTATVLDERVCECCQTTATRTSRGLLALYRDRDPDEIRDVVAVQRRDDSRDSGAGAWTEPVQLGAEGWNIAGCPVNGPAVGASGDTAFATWFTAADGTPRVRAATSQDGGATFGAAAEVDGDGDSPTSGDRGAPLGRVDLAVAGPARPNGASSSEATAVVSWLGGDGGVWLRRLPADGAPADAVRVGRTGTDRASGIPRVETFATTADTTTDTNAGAASGGHDAADAGADAGAAAGDAATLSGRLAVTWVEPGDGNGTPGRLRFATLPLADLP